jgi:hypothetical protein
MSAISLSALSFADLIAMREELKRLLCMNLFDDQGYSLVEVEALRQKQVDVNAEIKKRLIWYIYTNARIPCAIG